MQREADLARAAPLTFAKMVKDPSFPVKAYTSLPDGASLQAFYDLLNCHGQAERLLLYTGPKDLDIAAEERERRGKEKRGRSRILLPEDGLALTLTVLRTDMTFVEAAPLFGVSDRTASRHFSTWLSFLDISLTAMFPYVLIPQTTLVPQCHM